jgi:hypothetical protein
MRMRKRKTLNGSSCRYNINRQWVGDILAEAVEKVDVIAFSFPPVPIVGIEATEHH